LPWAAEEGEHGVATRTTKEDRSIVAEITTRRQEN
jgi:hypothetical protein